MKTLVRTLAQRPPGRWDSVVAIGAGAGNCLSLVRSLETARLLLVEPGPEQAESLAAVIDRSREKVLRLAVAASPGEVVLHLCSAPRFSSIASPTGMASLLPNLRPAGETRVPASTLRGLLAAEQVDPSANNLLVVALPGQSVAMLADPSALRAFAAVVLSVGEEPLFEGDPDLASLHARLGEMGFDYAGDDPDAIYPLAIQLFLRNGARIGAALLADQVDALQKERDALAARGDELERKCSALAKEEAAARQARDEALASVAAMEERLSETARQLDAEREAAAQAKLAADESLDQARQQLLARAGELEEARADAKASGAAMEARLSETARQLDAEREAAAQAKLAADRSLDQARQQLLARAGELEEARADARASGAAMEAKLSETVRQLDAEREAAVQAKLAADRSLDQARAASASLDAELSEVARQLQEEREELKRIRHALDEAKGDAARQRAAAEAASATIAELRKSESESRSNLEAARAKGAEHLAALEETKALLQRSSLQSQERGARLIELEGEVARLQKRQAWFDREMAKAEGQLELVRDLVLRER
jgi:chromosome segregation ATPase